MSNLEDLRNEILEFSKGKFHIFRAFDLLRNIKSSIQWRGDNIEEFLSICQSLNIDVLYLHEGRLLGDREHGSEPAVIQLGFYHNGILHILFRKADWLTGLYITE